MKKYINTFLSVAAVATLSLVGCSRENPFGEGDTAMGAFRTSSLNVNINTEENIGRSQADDAPELSTFTVAFYKEGEESPSVTYRYDALPEIVTLPVGTYSAVAYSGNNPLAAWDAPYYRGESESFEITPDAVTEVSDPVVCRLANVKVSVLFDDDLTAVMSADSKVTVTVGETGSLEFTKTQENRHGYFAYTEESRSLTAVFEGFVEDYPTTVSKIRENVDAGSHYIITFSLKSAGEEEPGSLSPAIDVDASVTVEDVNGNVVTDDEYLEDDLRPSEGDDPDTPTPPGDDDGNGPVVSVTPDSNINLDAVNDFYEGVVCKLEITSDAPDGITGFVVDIDSPTLTPAELEGVGLASHLDLINPGELEDALSGLGFPVGAEVKNQHKVTFDISGFGGLLGMLGAGEHKFVLTVTDANGKTVQTLRLRTL